MSDTPEIRAAKAKLELQATSPGVPNWARQLLEYIAGIERELADARAEIEEIHATGGASYSRLAKAEAERDAAVLALKHQRTALSLVRDRQCHDGICTIGISDLEKGIAQLDAAIAARKP